MTEYTSDKPLDKATAHGCFLNDIRIKIKINALKSVEVNQYTAM